MNYSTSLTDARRGSTARNAMAFRSELGCLVPVPIAIAIAVGDGNGEGDMTASVKGNGITCGEVRLEEGLEDIRNSYGTFINKTAGPFAERQRTYFLPHLWEWAFFGVLIIMGFLHWYGWGVGGEFGTLLYLGIVIVMYYDGSLCV